jgi:hypothetical protein
MIIRETKRSPERPRPAPSADLLVARAKRHLTSLGLAEGLSVRHLGQHLLVDRDGEAVARLTALGRDAFGVAFRAADSKWEPMVLIDSLEELLSDVVVALDLAPAAAAPVLRAAASA